MSEEQAHQTRWIVLSAVAPVAVALLLLPLRDEMLSVNVALVLVVVVVALARYGGRVAGAVAAVMSTLAFDLLHTEPYGHLRIDSVDEIETTLLLAVVGLTVGSVAARARYARAATEELVDEVARIHRVTEMIAAGSPLPAVVDAVEYELSDLLGLRACRFERPPFASTLPVIDHAGRVLPVTHYRFRGDGFELPAEGVELLVDNRGETLGRFVLDPKPGHGVEEEARRSAVVLADLVGVALVEADQGPPPARPGQES